MVIVIHGLKGVLAKESPVKGYYEQGCTGLWSPFRNTGQGVCSCGEANCSKQGAVAKATSP